MNYSLKKVKEWSKDIGEYKILNKFKINTFKEIYIISFPKRKEISILETSTEVLDTTNKKVKVWVNEKNRLYYNNEQDLLEIISKIINSLK